MFIQIVGLLLILLVTVRLLQSIRAATFSNWYARQCGKRSLHLLNEKIAAVRALREQREAQESHWSGYRKFRVKRKEVEAKDIASFYLVPHDQKPLPRYLPGQFVTFRFHLPAEKSGTHRSVIRCYSLSDAPRSEHFRITVKRASPPPDSNFPPGVISNYLHDHVQIGDILDLQAPRGDFCLDPAENKPVVLIGGGVGVTPMLSMANALLEAGTTADIWFFYGVRCKADHAMREHLAQLATRHENFHLHICYSCPEEHDKSGEDFHTHGYIKTSLIQEIVKVTNLDFYICGPPAMMDSLSKGLVAWGVSEERIHSEAFGPATIQKSGRKQKSPSSNGQASSGSGVAIHFERSGQELIWDGSHDSLLDFALEHAIDIESGCRAGSCGSCEIAVKQGTIRTRVEPGVAVNEGSCLACISYPEGKVVLDA